MGLNDISSQQAQDALDNADCLYTEQQVEKALDVMAEAISCEFSDKNPILVCVLVGGVVPCGKLVTRLNFPLQMDYVHASRYRGETSGGELHWLSKPKIDLKDRIVLIVDDILDEGLTLASIKNSCQELGAKAVYSVVLVHKIHDRKPGMKRADFTGLEVEDRYVFGYGMDYKGYLRNAAGIFAVAGM